MNFEEVQQLLKAVKDDNFMHTFLSFAVLTGMRKSEMLGLEWSEVDFDKDLIKVKQIFQRVEGEGVAIQEWTKNNKIRFVPISMKVKAILKKIKTEQSKTKILLNKKNKYDLVFAKENEIPASPSYIYRRFKQHCKKEGFEDINFHSLRHTFASLLKQNGVDIKTIQELLGHTVQSTTANIYTHVSPKSKKAAAEKIDQIF